MRLIGYVLFVSGLLISVTQAAYIPEAGEGLTARVGAWFDVVGTTFLLGLSQMVVGAFLTRAAAAAALQGAAKEAEAGDGVAPDPVAAAGALLAGLASTLAPLSAADLEGDRTRQSTLKAALDEVLEDQVPDVLELRAALMDALGLESFATMIGHFASMERNAARAWSALTDEAWAEVGPCLDRAREGLQRARDALPA